jgi:hypothetical protein
MKKLEIILPATIIVFTLFVVGAGAFYYNYSIAVMRFPYFVGAVLIGLSALRLVQAIKGKRLPGEPEEIQEPTTESMAEFTRTALWLVAILPSVWLLGYLAGIPLYLLAYFRAHGESWLMSISLALGALAVTYFVFIVFLRVNLPVMPLGFQ